MTMAVPIKMDCTMLVQVVNVVVLVFFIFLSAIALIPMNTGLRMRNPSAM